MILVLQLVVGLAAVLLGMEIFRWLDRWPWPNRYLRPIATIWFVYAVSLLVRALLIAAAG